MGGSINQEGKNKGWREAERGKDEGNKDGAHNSDEATFFSGCLDVTLESQSHFTPESSYIFTESLQFREIA